MKFKINLFFYIFLPILFLGVGIGVAVYLFRWDIFNPLHAAVLKADNMERKFYYHVPKMVTQHPKLVFVLHGSGMGGKEMQLVTGHQFNKMADANKDAIIVYPEGYMKYWNDCRKSAIYDAKLKNVDDAGFFERMIDFFSEKYNIDRNEVFATGYSNGGQMCFKLAKEKPGLFKGFAVISANLPIETNNDCYESNQPVSILVMNGTSDPINPYNGGEITAGDGKNRGKVISTEETMRYWERLSKCDSTSGAEHAFPDINKDDSSTAIEYDYKCPATNKEITLIKVINGGHNIPNPTFSLWPVKKVGNVNKDINAPEIIFGYFMNLK